MFFGKRGQVWNELVPWIIGIGVLVLVIGLYIVLKDKGQAAISLIERIRRYGS